MKRVKQSVKQNTGFCGVPGAIRTLDPLLRRQPLCPTELQGHAKKAEGNNLLFQGLPTVVYIIAIYIDKLNTPIDNLVVPSGVDLA